MKKIFSILSSEEKSVMAVCTFISLAITWFSAEPVFAMVTSGKALHGRSIVLQFGFYAILFLLFLAISLLFLRSPVRWFLKNPLFSFMLISLVPLSAHAYMGSFSRFVADDFSSATLAVNKGILSATIDWYVNWSGRFSASFFDSVMGYLPPSAMMWETGLALFLLLLGCALSVWQLIEPRSRIDRFSLAVMIPAVILTGGFALAPDLPQALYWGQGMRSLIFPLVPASFITASLIFLARTNSIRISYYVTALIGVLAFIAGGFGETYVVLQITAIGLISLVVVFLLPKQYRDRLLPALILSLIFSIVSMLLIIAAPGNSVRQTYFPPTPGLFQLIQISFVSLIDYFTKILDGMGVVICLLIFTSGFLLSKCLCAFYNNNEITTYPEGYIYFSSKFRVFFTVMMTHFLVFFASFVPAAYGMSTSPPDRTLVLPSLILANLLAALGILAGLYVQKSSTGKYGYPLSTRWTVFVLFSLACWWITAGILAPVDDYRFFANRFDRADRIIREAKAAGLSSVEVPEVHNHFGLSDYGAGTTYWLDNAVNSYYGIEVIINKHMK